MTDDSFAERRYQSGFGNEYAELAVIRPTEKGLVLEETAPGVSVREVVDATDADLILAPGLAP